MTEFYDQAKKLYHRGCYLEALAQLEGHLDGPQGEEGQLKQLYFLALLISIDLVDGEKFRELFFQLKEKFLLVYGLESWIDCLQDMLKEHRWPEFFIRGELAGAYKQVGRIEDLRRISQKQIDRSIEKRRFNVDLDSCEYILGEHVNAYRILHQIYRGDYKDAMDQLKKIKGDKFKKLVNFIASNITPLECKRIEIVEIIAAHLDKKCQVSLVGHKREKIKNFGKAIIRNFINIIVLDCDNKNYIRDLVKFVSKIDTKLRDDLIEDAKKIFNEEEYESLKNENIVQIKESYEVKSFNFSQDKELYQENFLTKDISYKNYEEDEEAQFSVTLKGILNAQEDDWSVENFDKIMTEIMGFKLYRLGLDVIRKASDSNNKNIDMVSIYYFKSECYLALKDYINVLQVCREALNLSGLSLSNHICFEYFTGEAYWSLGEGKKAYARFKKVFDVEPSYRLVSERLKIIEKN